MKITVLWSGFVSRVGASHRVNLIAPFPLGWTCASSPTHDTDLWLAVQSLIFTFNNCACNPGSVQSCLNLQYVAANFFLSLLFSWTDYQLERLLTSRSVEDVIHEQLDTLMGTPEGNLFVCLFICLFIPS